MGCYSPAPVLPPEREREALDSIIRPALAEMAHRGTPFRGVLYAGLMMTSEGATLIEFNVRFGDPECQVLMLRLKSDLLPALLAACDGELSTFDLRWRDEAAITVVMATRGYPGKYPLHTPIGDLEAASSIPGAQIFHAGTELLNGRLVSTGGRVLNVSATGPDIRSARALAYAAWSRSTGPTASAAATSGGARSCKVASCPAPHGPRHSCKRGAYERHARHHARQPDQHAGARHGRKDRRRRGRTGPRRPYGHSGCDGSGFLRPLRLARS